MEMGGTGETSRLVSGWDWLSRIEAFRRHRQDTAAPGALGTRARAPTRCRFFSESRVCQLGFGGIEVGYLANVPAGPVFEPIDPGRLDSFGVRFHWPRLAVCVTGREVFWTVFSRASAASVDRFDRWFMVPSIHQNVGADAIF